MARSASCSTPVAGLVASAGQTEARAHAQVATGDARTGTASADSTRWAITGPSVPSCVALDQDGELVAADAGDRVADAHARPQPLAHRHEQPVAGIVAEAVVHRLEVVEVDEQHGHRLVAPLLERVVEAVAEQRPVGELGERIVEGLELQLALPLAELGHRLLEAAGELTVLEHRQHLATDEEEQPPRST